MLVSRLALVDALPAPTAELYAQHRYKTLVVDTTDLAGSTSPSNDAGGTDAWRGRKQNEGQHIAGTGLKGPGILTSGAERGRGLRDTRYGTAGGPVSAMHACHSSWSLWHIRHTEYVPWSYRRHGGCGGGRLCSFMSNGGTVAALLTLELESRGLHKHPQHRDSATKLGVGR